MPNAIFLHGTSGSPDEFWFPWLAAELERHHRTIWRPALPEPDRADLMLGVPFVVQYGHFDHETLLIGHSAGVPLALAVLQELDYPIKRTLLVAGFCQPLPGMQPDHPSLPKNPDWAKIRRNCRDFVFFHADNDPWGCDHHQGEFMRQKLGGTLIVRTGEGHFGSTMFNQPYTEFPLLRDFCLHS